MNKLHKSVKMVQNFVFRFLGLDSRIFLQLLTFSAYNLPIIYTLSFSYANSRIAIFVS